MGKPSGLQRLELATHGLRPWLFYPLGGRKQGLEGFEPSAYGLGNRGATIHPVGTTHFQSGPMHLSRVRACSSGTSMHHVMHHTSSLNNALLMSMFLSRSGLPVANIAHDIGQTHG